MAVNYVNNVWDALTGKKTEKFQSHKTPKPYISVVFLISFCFSMLFYLAYGYGAANLSFCLNKSLGRTDVEALGWAVLAFVFNGFYYPYYGIFLNPVCAIKRNVVGGRR
jgi:hypothetical protein